MAKKDVPGDPKKQGLGSLAGKVVKRATPVLRIGSSLYDAYTALPQEIKDKVRDSILPPPDQETVGPSSFPPIETEQNEGTGVTSLPMDEASRMQRAQDMGFTLDAYHGTRDDFTTFERGDLGYHFGTPGQASTRLRHTRDYGWAGVDAAEAGENIMPVKLRLQKVLELPDVGNWKNPVKVAEAALQTPWGQGHEQTLVDIMEDAEDLAPTFEDQYSTDHLIRWGEPPAWTDSLEASELMYEIRSLMEMDGYDGIKYENKGEIEDDMALEEYDPYSYIVFSPENIRSSISAEYDPEQSESPDITKAHGGFVDKPLYDRNRSYYG